MEVENRLEVLRTGFEEVKNALLLLWEGPPEFKNQEVTIADLQAVS